VTWLFRIETTGVKLDRIGVVPPEQALQATQKTVQTGGERLNA
jgi:hypothetical protein